ncbi:MAG: alpha/beta fold hydrolase [Desulfobacterales bacterium]
MTAIRLYLLGSPRLEKDGRTPELKLKKAMGILAYLAVTGRPHTRDSLAALFWPESNQKAGRASLRRTLHRLRLSAGGRLLNVEGDQVGVAGDAVDLWVDALAFQSRCSAAKKASDTDVTAVVDALTEAAALYVDAFMAGFHLADCPAFDEWQFFESERLQQQFIAVLDELIRCHMAAGRHDLALAFAHRRVAAEPLNEAAHRTLIQLYSRTDQKAAALRQFRECRRILEKELGTTPRKETRDLIDAIRRSPPDGHEPAAPRAPEIRYAKSGDVHIAYQVIGRGPVDLLFVPGFVSHLELAWEDPDLAAFFSRLAGMTRLILFDRRGVGLSDRIGYPPGLKDTARDIEAVMTAAGSRKAVMMGVSEGGPAISLFAATRPSRVRGLILYGTMAKGSRTEDYPWVLTAEQYNRWLADLVARWSEGPGIEGFAPSRAADRRFRNWWARLLRFGSSPGMVRSVLEALRDIDIREVLPAIQIPTLVLHRRNDQAILVGNGRYLARSIPGAIYKELEGEDHWWWVGDQDSIHRAIQAFVSGLGETRTARPVLATLCYGEFSGGAFGKADEIERETILADPLERYGGRMAGAEGNRFLVTFGGPSQALGFALETLGAAMASNLRLRVGLHAGECILVDDHVAGVAVQVAARILDRAEDGQALMSNAVAMLAAGSGFRFTDRGTHRLEGVTGSWRLLSLNPGR